MTDTPPLPAATAPDPTAEFLARCHQALAQGQFLHLLLANPATQAGLGDLQRVMAKPVVIKGVPCLSFTLRHPTRDITHNAPYAEGLAQVQAWAGAGFRNLHLFTPGQETQLAFNRKGRATLRVGKSSNGADNPHDTDGNAPAAMAHNREKQRMLDLHRPFLAALGVTDAQGHLASPMARKWKQINKFLEVLRAALEGLHTPANAPIRVADFGSGKGYLTFAVHDHLTHTLQRPAQVSGVELRADMVALCNGVVRKLGLRGLQFEAGDLRTFTPRPLDVVIALHACDTATDHAMALAVRAGAQVIVCSPCCHKQLRPQLLAPHALRPVLQHGIHLGQEAEMVTDSLRALLLQAHGYATQVFEFVALEHTAKNKMILAVKGGAVPPRAEVLAQVALVKGFYGITEQALEGLLESIDPTKEAA
jgi:SAM-dependent methyltransferase